MSQAPPPPPPSYPVPQPGMPAYPSAPHPGASAYGAAPGPAPGVVFVPFWPRFSGYLIDVLILEAVTLALVVPLVIIPLVDYFAAHPIVAGHAVTLPENIRGRLAGIGLFGAAVSALYYGGMVARWGRTLGQRVIGARVVRAEDGGALPAGRAFLRAGIWWAPPLIGLLPVFGGLAGLAALIGLLSVAWDSRKQGWHDKIARSFVVREDPRYAAGPGAYGTGGMR